MTETDTPANALILAEAKHAELEARLQTAREDAAASRAKAHSLAFAAEGADDVDARRMSTKLLADADKLQDDITHRLEPAVGEAARRVTAAKEAVAKEAQRENAEEAHALASRLEELGRQMDEGFAQALAAKGKAIEIISKLNRIGAGSPQVGNVESIIEHQAYTTLRRTGLAPQEPKPLLLPLQRRSFNELFSGWGA